MPGAARSALLLIACVPLALVLSGCGPKTVIAHGKLLDKGQPLHAPENLPPGDPGIHVTFYPADEKLGKQAQMAVVNPDGTFRVPGNSLRGVVPGKYRVSITLGPLSGADKLKGAFSGLKSPIVREVKENNEEIVIDISKPNG
jgi:hypothetical protein